MRVLIAVYHPLKLWCAPEWLKGRLQQHFPGHDFEQIPDYSTIAEKIVDADVLIAWSIRPEQLRCARKLRWIHSPAAAVHQLMFPEVVAGPIVVTNARDVHGPVVAEHAIAVLLALAKRLPDAMRMQQRKYWGQGDLMEMAPPVREVRGATVCMVGMGSIGRRFTLHAKALGMHVIAVREHPERGADGADEVCGMNDLARVFPRADYIVLAPPLTPASEGMINAERLSWMKKEACLINVGRGPLIDDAALVAALRERKIAGAALDVFAEEPLPADSSYWQMENVLITPHTAAVTDNLWERHWEQISTNLKRFIAGEPLLYTVDKSRGY